MELFNTVPLDMVFVIDYMHHLKKKDDILNLEIEKKRSKMRLWKTIGKWTVNVHEILLRPFDDYIEVLSPKIDKKTKKSVPLLRIRARIESLPDSSDTSVVCHIFLSFENEE